MKYRRIAEIVEVSRWSPECVSLDYPNGYTTIIENEELAINFEPVTPDALAAINDDALKNLVATEWIRKNKRMDDGYVFVVDIIDSYRAALRERI